METQQQQQQNINPSPCSSSSSPSHEFSFTISLHSNSNDKSKPPPSPSPALDLSPADDIFFHGHLLPLHLLSPRFSTNSNDSFTLPIFEHHHQNSIKSTSSFREEHIREKITTKEQQQDENKSNNSNSSSSFKHSFSLFGSTKQNQNREKQNKKKLVGHDMIQALKKYLRMVQQVPLEIFRGKREKSNRFERGAYSRSGNLIRRNKPEIRGSRGEYSAPASMRTSPTNSGLLIAKGGGGGGGGSLSSSSSGNDSTMEELHAAIQAAIAHCKNSIAEK